MPFCSTCGADMANSSFCAKCGAPAGRAPAMATPAAVPAAPVVPPRAGKVSPIFWILGGIVVFILLVVIVVAATGMFFAHKFMENPAMTTAKLLTAGNPNVEVLSVDNGRNKVTFRDKQTGETVTMDFEDLKRGKIVFKSKGQEATLRTSGDGQNGTMEIDSPQGTVKFGAGGNAAKIPSWVPVYPGVSPQVNFSMQGSDADGGTFQFKTKDSAKDVLSFYEQALKTAGFGITANISGNLAAASGAMLTAEDPASKRTVMVTAGTEDSGANVNVVFGTNKK
jgi:hypothetical protein